MPLSTGLLIDRLLGKTTLRVWVIFQMDTELGADSNGCVYSQCLGYW